MLNALLETFGALAILASIALKFVKPSTDVGGCNVANMDKFQETVPPGSYAHHAPSRRKVCTRARRGKNK